jgi:SAM-dependent methyltransferase
VIMMYLPCSHQAVLFREQSQLQKSIEGFRLVGMIGALHERLVFGRRVRVLASHFAALIPAQARILDVGCGDGLIDCLIQQQRPDISIEGIDPLVRSRTHIPVRSFDGAKLPYPGASFDAVMFVDVLHHTVDPKALLREAMRVGKIILIKDHIREGFLASGTLRVMDWVGNAHHGVALPYNYWSRSQWREVTDDLGLKATEMRVELALYPPPISWIFDRRLHFVARFERAQAPAAVVQ